MFELGPSTAAAKAEAKKQALAAFTASNAAFTTNTAAFAATASKGMATASMPMPTMPMPKAASSWSFKPTGVTVDVKAVTDGKPQQPNCAWQAFVTGGNGANINAAFPDSHCVYQVLVMSKVTEDRIFRIKAKFPTGGNRYFSLQSNNPKVGFPLATIRDF